MFARVPRFFSIFLLSFLFCANVGWSSAPATISSFAPSAAASAPPMAMVGPSALPSAPPFLDWTQRPEDVRSEIGSAFSTISSETASQWGKFNGNKHYYLLELDEFEVFKKIIKEAPPTQKDFVAVEVGAGNFDWGASLANFINSQTDLPSDIRVHIFSLRGEINTGPERYEDRRCTLYNLGSFPVENPEAEFKKRGVDLTNKVDFGISHWCFPHLVDPLADYVSYFNMLRPTTGVMMLDSFRLLYEDDDSSKYWHQKVYQYGSDSTYNFNWQMLNFFAQIKAPILVADSGETVAHYQFMVRRPNENKANLPMGYLGAVPVAGRNPYFERGATHITRYRKYFSPLKEDDVKNLGEIGTLYGNYDLYRWLPPSAVGGKKWGPFLVRDLTDEGRAYRVLVDAAEKERKDKAAAMPPPPVSIFRLLREALSSKNSDAVNKILDANWSDIEDADKGRILLMGIDSYDINPGFFDSLLARDININYRHGGNGTALHHIIWMLKYKDLPKDQAIELTKKLLDHGARRDITDAFPKTPLDRARDLPDQDLFNFLSTYRPVTAPVGAAAAAAAGGN